MPERLECEVLQKARYINTLTFTFTFIVSYFVIKDAIKQVTLNVTDMDKNQHCQLMHKLYSIVVSYFSHALARTHARSLPRHWSVATGGFRILVWEGHWQEVWGTEVPSGIQGQTTGGIRLLRHEYDNIIIIKCFLETKRRRYTIRYDTIVGI